MLELPPLHGGRRCKKGEYAELSVGLNDYFRSLVDEAMDYARYTTRKQLESETVHEFALKLQDLAARVNVTRDSIAYRHQFLSGLRDREFAKKAMVDGMQMRQILQQAGRMEQAAGAEGVKPWSEEPQRQAVVMAVESKPRKFGGDGKFGKKRPGQGRSDQAAAKWRKCGTCGRREHPSGEPCPALGKRCLSCGTMGHFASVCSGRVKMDTDSGAKQEVNEVVKEEVKVR